MYFIVGVPMETAQPRSPRPQPNPQAGAPIIQVHRLYRNIWHVQAIREPRVLGAQRGRQASYGQEQGIQQQQQQQQAYGRAAQAPQDQRRDHDYTPARQARRPY